ncbi:MAG: AsmA family protein [Candidatus Omnitrophica bacterium]|nr:AsmA family protein [Candidatus Omnitrophota bacterium]
MKRLLRIVALLLLLALIGLAVFIATCHVDRYRPVLVAKLQEAIGAPVALEHIALGWKGGVALELQGFAIFPPGQIQDEPLIQMPSASALVRLGPLLRREIRIASIVLQRPRIHVTRDAQGRINLLGLVAAAGPVAASAKTVPAGAKSVSFTIASLRIEQGSLHWTDDATRPPMDVRVTSLDVTVSNIVAGQPMEIDLRGALGSDRPTVHIIGKLTPPSASQAGSLERAKLTIERLPLERLVPAPQPGEVQLRGSLTMALQGQAATLDPPQLMRSISGNGTLTLEDPVIVNLNILRAVFEKLSIIPGLVEALEARLPPADQAKLTATDTVCSPIHTALQLDHGMLRFTQLEIHTDTFGLSGTGHLGVDGSVQIQATLRIEPAFSSALIRSVKELQGLTNPRGEMEIPLAIQGQAPRVAVLPDLHDVASKLLVTTVQDLLGNLLQKTLQHQAPSDGSPQP